MNRPICWLLLSLVLTFAATAEAAQPAAPAKPDAAKPAAKPKADATKPTLHATVKEVSGTVETRSAVGQPWTPAKVGTTLAEGADLRTGFRARCILDMVDSLVKIDPLTVVRIGELAHKDGKVRTRLIMKQGRAEAIVEKEHLESDFAIVTPSATLSVRGTKGVQAGFYPDRGGWYGLAGPGLVQLREHLLNRTTYCTTGQYTNDSALPPGQMLHNGFLPPILPLNGLDPNEANAAGRWNTGNPIPSGLGGTLGPLNAQGKDNGQQTNPLNNITPADFRPGGGERRGDITHPPVGAE